MRLLKLFFAFILLLIIAASASFVYFKISAQDTGNNFFNSSLRYKFARYPIMRQILGLHFDGDARSDYLGTRDKKILIKIIPMNGLGIDEDAIKLFSEHVQKITGKTTSYLYYPPILYRPESTLEELQTMLEANSASVPSQTAALNIIIAGKNTRDDMLLGSTLRENGIVLFENVLNDNMRNEKPERIDSYLATLLLHEFGHQLGLSHNSLSGCLMNENTDFSDKGRLLTATNDFCDSEKDEIKKMIF
jgi:hypothetical protein